MERKGRTSSRVRLGVNSSSRSLLPSLLVWLPSTAHHSRLTPSYFAPRHSACPSRSVRTHISSG